MGLKFQNLDKSKSSEAFLCVSFQDCKENILIPVKFAANSILFSVKF